MGIPEVEALKAALVRNDHWAEVCTICVFAGLIVEYTILLWFKRKDFSRLEITLTIIAGVAIAGGVFGEYHFGSAASDAALRLESISEQQVAELEKEAAGLKKDAEAESLERVRLEAIVAPRSLSLEQQRLIASACGRFHGHGVLVSSYGMDGEGAALGGQIISALQSTGIIVADARASIMVTGGFEMGVHVRGPDAERDLVSSLGNALSSIGKLKVSLNDLPPRVGGAGMGGGGQSFPAGTVFVTVMVGIKPVPILAAK